MRSHGVYIGRKVVLLKRVRGLTVWSALAVDIECAITGRCSSETKY